MIHPMASATTRTRTPPIRPETEVPASTAGQDGAFADLRRRQFYRTVGRLAMARGALRLTYMVWRVRRVAYQFGIVEGDRVQILEGLAAGDEVRLQ